MFTKIYAALRGLFRKIWPVKKTKPKDMLDSDAFLKKLLRYPELYERYGYFLLRHDDKGAVFYEVNHFNLDKHDFALFLLIRNVFLKSKLSVEHLINIFNGWQSKRTTLSKKLVLAPSLVFWGVVFVGSDLSKVNFLGIKLDGDASLSRFFCFVASFLLVSVGIFIVSYAVDEKIRLGRLHINFPYAPLFTASVDFINFILNREGIALKDLITVYKVNSRTFVAEDFGAYQAMKFYKDHLGFGDSSNRFLDRFEFCLVVLSGISLAVYLFISAYLLH